MHVVEQDETPRDAEDFCLRIHKTLLAQFRVPLPLSLPLPEPLPEPLPLPLPLPVYSINVCSNCLDNVQRIRCIARFRMCCYSARACISSSDSDSDEQNGAR